MKPKTKAQINQIARLMWNESMSAHDKITDGVDFSSSLYKWHKTFWNMALIAYVEIKQEYGLLKEKI